MYQYYEVWKSLRAEKEDITFAARHAGMTSLESSGLVRNDCYSVASKRDAGFFQM